MDHNNNTLAIDIIRKVDVIETDFSLHRYNNRREIENLQSEITAVCRPEKLHENFRKVKLLSLPKWTGTVIPECSVYDENIG